MRFDIDTVDDEFSPMTIFLTALVFFVFISCVVGTYVENLYDELEEVKAQNAELKVKLQQREDDLLRIYANFGDCKGLNRGYNVN